MCVLVSGWLDTNKDLFSTIITGAFTDLMSREHFLLDYFSLDTMYSQADDDVIDDDVRYDNDDVLKYAKCFANIIDCRSPFTYSHSSGIAELARKAAVHLGYSDEEKQKMFISGLLHDLGKLYIPVSILHKKDKLTPEERFEINKHTYYTRKILNQIDGFEDIVHCAANHHEKLDGTGYPYRIPGASLCEPDKIMAICDVYQALSEERPYRDKMPPDKVWRIIDDMADKDHLDTKLVSRMKQVFA